MRVVSTTCSNTEIVRAVGAADLLIGVDDHSDFPADVDVDPDNVAALAPQRLIDGLCEVVLACR